MEWIPCAEQIPDKSGDYLVTMVGGRVTLCTFIIGDARVPDWWCGYKSDGFTVVPRNEIIAWAQLPTPYRSAPAGS